MVGVCGTNDATEPTITVQEFRIKFGEFSNTSDETISMSINAACDINQSYYSSITNTKSKQLNLYLTAHYLKVDIDNASNNGSGEGSLKSVRMDGFQKDYQTDPKDSNTFTEMYKKTGYGQTYLRLIITYSIISGSSSGIY